MNPKPETLPAETPLTEIMEQRQRNFDALTAAGFGVAPEPFARSASVSAVRANFADGATHCLAGRVTTIRDMGKSIFADLRDGTDRLQLYLQQKHLGDAAFTAFKHIDLGDILGVCGDLFTTRTGEPSLRVDSWRLLSKALRPPPEKWHGLKDVEACYRRRYLDLMANPASRDLFRRRSEAVREIRAFLNGREFQEVETPMMQPLPGGAAARPFRTRYDALHTDMFLRIAPELYLKRLLVGGFERIFELNRNFRNEGLSRSHNPEFTMLEVYEAYGDRTTMQQLVQEMILHVRDTVFAGHKPPEGVVLPDFTPPWREISYRDLVREAMGAEWFEWPTDAARVVAESRGLTIDPAWDHAEITHEVYEKLIERSLRDPTFVTRLPKRLVPLARACADDPESVDVFELVIGGWEVAPGYSELNDPLEQRRRLSAQAATAPAGSEEAIDTDFLEALEHGMPPAGGMGVGIDRLIMVLSGVDAIRDVILFPQLRPR